MLFPGFLGRGPGKHPGDSVQTAVSVSVPRRAGYSPRGYVRSALLLSLTTNFNSRGARCSKIDRT